MLPSPSCNTHPPSSHMHSPAAHCSDFKDLANATVAQQCMDSAEAESACASPKKISWRPETNVSGTICRCDTVNASSCEAVTNVDEGLARYKYKYDPRHAYRVHLKMIVGAVTPAEGASSIRRKEK